jgi:hypothetical protein
MWIKGWLEISTMPWRVRARNGNSRLKIINEALRKENLI